MQVILQAGQLKNYLSGSVDEFTSTNISHQGVLFTGLCSQQKLEIGDIVKCRRANNSYTLGNSLNNQLM